MRRAVKERIPKGVAKERADPGKKGSVFSKLLEEKKRRKPRKIYPFIITGLRGQLTKSTIHREKKGVWRACEMSNRKGCQLWEES